MYIRVTQLFGLNNTTNFMTIVYYFFIIEYMTIKAIYAVKSLI